MNLEKTECIIKATEIEPEEIRGYMTSVIGEKIEDKIYNFLSDLKEYYPNFKEWFVNTITPSINKKDGEREILIMLTKHEISGVAILKRTKNEKKICAIRVNEKYRKAGIGSSLFEECFKYLGTDKPLISISEKNLEYFRGHIKKYNFKLEEKLNGYYKTGIVEYVFNGKLEK